MAADLSWYQDARFGMFIHWGLYSMPARHEWIRNFEEIPNEDYEKYFELFDPDMFDPKEWARLAKAAGMRYVVFTAKHHEGFCMWDSKYTDYKITNTPFGRDALREIVDAFRAENIRIGLYYSLLDWHHPDFTIDKFHPLRNRPFEEREAYNAKCDMARYRRYMKDQITELLTQYGKIDVLWFDFSYKKVVPHKEGDNRSAWFGKGREDWGSEELLALIRKLQPQVIMDNRLDLPGKGDFETPEQYTPDDAMRSGDGSGAVWEGCQTLSGSWGDFRDENTWKSPKQCIDMLINHVSRGGNLLMNVGPTSRGYLDPRAVAILERFAGWMKYHARAIYGCAMAPESFPEPRDGRYTYNAKTKRLYLHLMNWPFKHVTLKNLGGKVRYAQFLHDGSEVKFRGHVDENLPMDANVAAGDIALELPPLRPAAEVPVIEIFLR
ncbi:MAG: alpha-L-fucosidase [Victivallaceae bacterium]|nr:alpha-L-fucosidase [Victivallaceae bacterium]